MKSSFATQMLKTAAGKNLSSLLNRFGVFSGNNPANGLQKGWEIITQPIRDYQAYPTAGFRSLAFFQNQSGAAGTTLENQNMPGAGSFPRGQMFVVEGMEVDFKPSGLPSVKSAPGVALQLNELYAVTRAGYLTMTIGTRPYLNVGPLSQFPPSFRVFSAGARSDTTTAAGAQAVYDQTPINQGEPFMFIPFVLEEVVNFSVALNYDTPVTVTSAGTIGVNMNGALIRRNQ